MFTSKEILDIALKIEQNGEAVYRQASHGLVNPDLAKRLIWMADEEARHAEWFMKLQADLGTHNNRIAVDEMNSDILHDLIGEQNFTLQDIDFTDVSDMRNLMDIFIEFEKDGILFYEMLRTFIKDPDVLESLDQIIAEEYRHIETLQEMKSLRTDLC
ncbi:ferritin family protein [Thermodesulfobacteriota bacterium]